MNLAAAIRTRIAPLGGVELALPPRDAMPDPIDFLELGKTLALGNLGVRETKPKSGKASSSRDTRAYRKQRRMI